MNTGFIRRIGSNRVDVQLAGSAATLSNVEVSAQVSWDLLAVGTRVLVDTVNDRPVVLHTLADNPLFYTPQAQTYDGIVQNALLADGSVPLMGNLPVLPGVLVDGYDISLLGQAISNLQAADTIARTGYTVLTHATHLVETIDADATVLLLRDNILATNEQLVVSNTAGQIEWMRALDAGTATLDDGGALCYRYTVTRRVNTNPPGLATGWAAATLVNGLTFRGYTVFDNRHGAAGSPSMRFMVWTDSPPTTVEHIVRIGNMNGVLGLGENDYGFAVGKLTTADRYISYNTTTDDLLLHNASLAVTDGTGSEVFRVYSRYEADHAPGDLVAGRIDGAQWNILPEAGEINLSNLGGKVLWITPTETRLGGLLSVGESPGPQVQLGMSNGSALIAARNLAGVAQFLVETNPATGMVHVHQGNPKPQGNWTEFENGVLTVDGTIRARDGVFLGTINFASTGKVVIRDPDDPDRYGELLPHGIVGRTKRADGSTYPSLVLAWAPLVVQTAPGVNKTFLAGDMLLGDPVYGNFQVKRSGMMGMFWGDTPKSYLDSAGNAVHDGLVYAQGGEFTGSVIIRDGGSLIFGDNNRLDHEGIKLNATYIAVPGYANALTWLDAASPSVTAARIFSYQGLATNYLVLEATDANSALATDADISLTANGGIGRQGTIRLSASGGGHPPSQLRVVQDSSGNGAVIIDNAAFVPLMDSTSAIQFKDAAGASTIFDVDTTNKRVGIGVSAAYTQMDVYGGIRSQSRPSSENVPTSGSGVEIGYYSDLSYGQILAYNRTGNAFLPLRLSGSEVQFHAGGSEIMRATSTGVVLSVVKPPSDSTSAVQIQSAGGGAVVTIDTTNGRMGVGSNPTDACFKAGQWGINPTGSQVYTGLFGLSVTPAAHQADRYLGNTVIDSFATGTGYNLGGLTSLTSFAADYGIGGTLAQLVGANIAASPSGSEYRTVSDAMGINASARTVGGTATRAKAIRAYLPSTGANGIIGDAFGIHIAYDYNNAGSVGNLYGLNIDDVVHGDNNYALVTHAGNVIFNEWAADADLIVRGDTDTSLVVCDASADAVGFGVGDPTAKVDIAASGSRASLRLRPGSDPANYENGDIWTDGKNIYAYLNGSIVTVVVS